MSGLLLQKILVCGKRIREIRLMAQRPFYSGSATKTRTWNDLEPLKTDKKRLCIYTRKLIRSFAEVVFVAISSSQGAFFPLTGCETVFEASVSE